MAQPPRLVREASGHFRTFHRQVTQRRAAVGQARSANAIARIRARLPHSRMASCFACDKLLGLNGHAPNVGAKRARPSGLAVGALAASWRRRPRVPCHQARLEHAHTGACFACDELLGLNSDACRARRRTSTILGLVLALAASRRRHPGIPRRRAQMQHTHVSACFA